MDISPSVLLFVSVFIVLLITSFFLIRNLKKKNIAASENLRTTGGVDGENAYSTIVTTESIAKFVGSQGADTSKATEYIGLAREAYGQRSYKLAVDYCEEAKVFLEDSKNKMPKEQLQAPDEEVESVDNDPVEYDVKGISSRLVELTETEQEDHKMVRLSRESNGEELKDLKQLDGLAEDAIEKRDNKLPSKFMIQRAREAIANAKKARRPVDEALEELDQAEDAFDREEFDLALSQANRARKMADGEAVPLPMEEKPAVASAPDIVVREEAEELFFCPSCNGKVNEDSKFCRHCGTKMIEEMLVCPGCDETIPIDSVFCPKCGNKQ